MLFAAGLGANRKNNFLCSVDFSFNLSLTLSVLNIRGILSTLVFSSPFQVIFCLISHVSCIMPCNLSPLLRRNRWSRLAGLAFPWKHYFLYIRWRRFRFIYLLLKLTYFLLYTFHHFHPVFVWRGRCMLLHQMVQMGIGNRTLNWPALPFVVLIHWINVISPLRNNCWSSFEIVVLVVKSLSSYCY